MLATKPTFDLSRIGASDAPPRPEPTRLRAGDFAAILGADPHRTRYAVWAERTLGVVEDLSPEATERRHWARVQRPLIVSAWSERRGHDLGASFCESRPHSVRDWQWCSPRLVLDDRARGGARLLLPVPVSEHRYEAESWGAEGSAEVPERIRIRALAHIEAMKSEADWWRDETGIDPNGIDCAEVAALVGGSRLLDYHVPWDAAGAADITARVEAFIRDHIATGVPPVVSGADLALFARASAPAVVPLRQATEEEGRLAQEHARVRAEIKKLEADEKSLRLALAKAIGNAEGMTVAGKAVRWVDQRGTVSWKDVAEALAIRAGISGAEYASVQERARRAAVRYVRNGLGAE